MQIIEVNGQVPAVQQEPRYRISDVRKELKARGLTGNALTLAVHQKMESMQPIADAFYTHQRSKGLRVTNVTTTKTGVTKFTLTPPPKDKKAVAQEQARLARRQAAMEAKLRELGIDPATLEA